MFRLTFVLVIVIGGLLVLAAIIGLVIFLALRAGRASSPARPPYANVVPPPEQLPTGYGGDAQQQPPGHPGYGQPQPPSQPPQQYP